uniref:dATP/dGTP diphosphohydrolase N-terminal domain-containing protein n=1 Tax=viral metagenome TaxID=1070528 RepID=A0A6M3L7R9_9ZZZZ
MAEFNEVKDSGQRQEFVTGSKRDLQDGKGYPTLIPTYPLRRLSRHYENGAKKYGKHNWTLGQPLSRYMDSLIRHVWAVLEGLDDEDHESAVIWNMISFMMTKKYIEEGQLPSDLDDMVYTVEDAKRVIENERRKREVHNGELPNKDG